MRIDIPVAIWRVCEQLASKIGVAPEVGVRMLLMQVAQSFADGDAMFLSRDFQAALRAVRETTYGMIEEAAPAINLKLLHQSRKTKSGFVGVYANGKGFRAMASTAGGVISIGSYPTAEEAAWRRRAYYKQHGLPYGELEVEMQRWRAGEVGPAFKGSDEELIVAIRAHAMRANTYDEIFGDGEDNVPPTLQGATKPPPKAALKPIGIDDEAAARIFGED